MGVSAKADGDGSARLRLGPTSMRWLSAIGVTRRDQLHRLGAAAVWRAAKAAFPERVSLNLLYALHAEALGSDRLPPGMKEALQAQVGQRRKARRRS